MTPDEALDVAARRVEYRLTYGMTPEPRECRFGAIEGPDLPNSYFYLYGQPEGDTVTTGSGQWDNPEHPDSDDPERHVDEWFTVAVREAIHEALEWFWVDGRQYLNPHGIDEDTIHDLSGEFARRLVELRRADRAEATP